MIPSLLEVIREAIRFIDWPFFGSLFVFFVAFNIGIKMISLVARIFSKEPPPRETEPGEEVYRPIIVPWRARRRDPNHPRYD